jgi:hypothetical protein
MSRVLFLICYVAGGIALNVNAYEVDTHSEVLTRQAANQSVLTNSATLGELGLDKGITDTAQQFPNSAGRSRTIRELLEDGSRFEDTIFPTLRPLRHFYNPLTGLGLGIPLLPTFMSSPDWALARLGSVSDQEFSYGNARQSLFDALTKPTEDERKVAFGRTFQALGQVVHHLQDMAQPQHVRNDVHCDFFVPCALIGAYAPSLYEGWTNDNRGSLPRDPSSVGYDITSPAFTSTFNSPRRFWNTEPPGTNSPITGKGIAEFTNRNFVSAGTNFDNSRLFPSPLLDESKKVDMDIQQLCANANPPCPNLNLTGVITFYGNLVEDKYTGAVVNNPFASSLSIFDADLRKTNGTPLTQPRLFTLNRFNFALAHSFLIPRAVGYSAGLINYFFRGKIDYVPDPSVLGNFLIKNLGPEDMTGKFALYYDAKDGTRKEVRDRQGNAVVWQTQTPLAANTGQMSVTPDFDPPADAKTLGEYMLVFSGDMGEEKQENGTAGAVVAKAITNPYSGILYLAGENAAGQLQFFKIDKNGVAPATGQHPFSVAYVDHTVRERSYDYKQAILRTAPSGATVYDIVGLELKTGSLGVLANASFVPDPVKGTLVAKLGIAWTARSSDPAIGTFEFTLQLQGSSGRVASLRYTRRFTDAQGRPAQASGVLSLPDPIGAGFTYNDFTSPIFSSGKLFMSGDGTKIYPRGDTASRKGLQITLGAIPTVAFFDLPQGTPITTTITPHANTTTQTGVCSIDYIANNLDGRPNFPATATGTQIRMEAWDVDPRFGNLETSGTNLSLEDFVNGGPLSYERRFQTRQLDHAITESCVAAGVDWSAGGTTPQVKVNVQFSKHVQLTSHQEEDDVLPNGAFQHVVESAPVARPATDAVMSCGIASGPAPGVSGPFTASGAPFLDIDYSYQGFGPCPTPAGTVYTIADTATEKKRIYRALTDRSADAIYSDENEPGVLKFRNETVPVSPVATAGNFVADASPIGEVFFATPDLSIFHHEPKNGNMPVLTRQTIPSGVVRLLAAIWM